MIKKDTALSFKKTKELKTQLRNHLDRKSKEPKELPKIVSKKADKFYEKIKGIMMITSRKYKSSFFVPQKHWIDDNITCDAECDVCGQYLRIYKKDSDDWVICSKASCELAKWGDDLPIITEDNILHYQGVVLTEADLI